MVNTETIRIIVGIIGNVISFGLFLSPIPTMATIVKGKSSQEFKSDPYVATLLNCMLWVFYGMPFVHPGSLLVITINGCGFVIELAYITIFLIYSPVRRKKWIVLALLIEVVFMVVLIFITMTFLHSTKARSMLIGILCIVFNIMMYVSPLTVLTMVIKTKSVKYMPFTLSLACFCNGIVWFIYALLKLDPYILVPNSVGSLFGLFQLGLYATYYKRTNWDEDDTRRSEVELSNT